MKHSANLKRTYKMRVLSVGLDIESEMELAVPTPEHYLPLLYTLAMKEENDEISFFNDKPVMGSLFMTSVRIS